MLVVDNIYRLTTHRGLLSKGVCVKIIFLTSTLFLVSNLGFVNLKRTSRASRNQHRKNMHPRTSTTKSLQTTDIHITHL